LFLDLINVMIVFRMMASWIDLATALTKQGIGAFRFDFSGNG